MEGGVWKVEPYKETKAVMAVRLHNWHESPDPITYQSLKCREVESALTSKIIFKTLLETLSYTLINEN
jgi:hypothetical protein